MCHLLPPLLCSFLSVSKRCLGFTDLDWPGRYESLELLCRCELLREAAKLLSSLRRLRRNRVSNENGCLPWKKLFRRRRIEGKSRRAAGRRGEDREKTGSPGLHQPAKAR